MSYMESSPGQLSLHAPWRDKYQAQYEEAAAQADLVRSTERSCLLRKIALTGFLLTDSEQSTLPVESLRSLASSPLLVPTKIIAL